jgi:hypothetical protein
VYFSICVVVSVSNKPSKQDHTSDKSRRWTKIYSRYTTSTHTHTHTKRKKMGVTGERVVRYKLPVVVSFDQKCVSASPFLFPGSLAVLGDECL